MTAQHWETLYQNAHKRGHERLQTLKGIACAFHSVIDGFIKLTPEIIKPVLDGNRSLKNAALNGASGEFKEEIRTPLDFITGMFYSLSRGTALQLMIRDKDTYQWVLNTFGPGELRLGGTSANMARSLAPLDIPVALYANPITKELAELFGPESKIKIFTERDGEYVTLPPVEAASGEGIFAIHWVFDYAGDFSMDIDGTTIAPGRANRYIPSWNPRNNQFQMSENFAKGFMQHIDDYDYLLFSGFHILSEKYPDGKTCEDVIVPLAEYLQKVHLEKPSLRIHLEMASIASSHVRDTILTTVVPHVHSIGLNEMELPLLLENLGHYDEAKVLRGHANAPAFCRAVKFFQDSTDLRRVHFHNLGYYICMESELVSTIEETRDSLLFAAVMAAARAKNGLFTKPDDIDAGISEEVSELGLEQVQKLSDELKQPSIAQEGIGEIDGRPFAVIPTKLVQKPLFTVGLGDTISSGAFLTE